MLRMQEELLVSPAEDFTGVSAAGQAPPPASAPRLHESACSACPSNAGRGRWEGQGPAGAGQERSLGRALGPGLGLGLGEAMKGQAVLS